MMVSQGQEQTAVFEARASAMLDAAEPTQIAASVIPDVSLSELEHYADLISENAMLDHITLQETLREIGCLPEIHRTAITLVCIEGHTYCEAADLLEVAVGTVMSRIFTARSKLRSMFG